MNRHLRHLAVAATVSAGLGLIPAGAAVAGITSPPSQALTIHDVLGGGHVSPYAGEDVSGIGGIVTDVISNGFYMQDPTHVGGTPFKQAIEVYTGSKPTVAAGDDVTVSGEVTEYYPGQSTTPSVLPIAELEHTTISIVSTGNPLPAPIVIGSHGVLPPSQNIYGGSADSSVDVTTDPTFDPRTRALDFYQGLYSSYVEVQNPVAVGPTNDYEFAVAPDNGQGAGERTPAGGLADINASTHNSRRLSVYAPAGVTPPTVNTGDHFTGTIAGIMTEYDGDPELDMTGSSAVGVSHGLSPEVAPPAQPGELSVATYNLDNLSPATSPAKFASLGSQIVNNLGSPDILAVQEIQDNDGATDDGVTDCTTTMTDLVNAISAAGGPTYSWTEIDPVNDADGGEPGGNIRQVTMYRTDAGLSLDSIPGGGSTVADSVTGTGSATALAQSPGRIDPTNQAWNAGGTLTSPATSRTEPSSASRKPLAAQFSWQGHSLFVINNHLSAKLEDDADFGRYQPPVQWSEIQREQQTADIAGFVQQIEQADKNAWVITLGDMNDQGFQPAIKQLEAGGAQVNVVDRLPQRLRYDYVFEGDSETLSDLLVSPALNKLVTWAQPVHINADFANQTSDHDPLLAYIDPPFNAARH